MAPDIISEQQISELINIAAESAEGKEGHPSTPEGLEAKEKIKICMENFFKTKEAQKLIDTVAEVKGKEYHERRSERTEGKSAHENMAEAVKIIGDLARELYEESKEALKKACLAALKTAKDLAETVLQIMLAIWFCVCTIAAIIVGISLRIISFIVSVVTAVIKGVWITIKKVTGFDWSTFVSAVHNPYFWAGVATAGLVSAIATPLVGGLICVVGVVGAGITGR